MTGFMVGKSVTASAGEAKRFWRSRPVEMGKPPWGRWRRQCSQHRLLVVEQVPRGQVEVRRIEALLKIELARHMIVVNACAAANHGFRVVVRLPGKAEARTKVVAVEGLQAAVLRATSEVDGPLLHKLAFGRRARRRTDGSLKAIQRRGAGSRDQERALGSADSG